MALDTEEEQIEKLERIWNNHKRLIIASVAILLGGYFLFNIYLDKKIKNNEQASAIYQEILIKKITEIDIIEKKVSLLKINAPNTPYASRAAIYLSRLYSQENKNAEAIKELIWASNNATEESIASMAYYTLANLYFVAGNLDEAMTAANQIDSVGFQSLAKDIIGDIYLKQGNDEQAKKSYLKSLDLNKGQGDLRKILQNKIDSIGQ